MATRPHTVLALAPTQQIARHMLDRGEVGWRVVAPYATLIVPKDHVHHPVKTVFDTPVAAYRLAYLLRLARQRAEGVAGLLFHFALGQQLTSALDPQSS